MFFVRRWLAALMPIVLCMLALACRADDWPMPEWSSNPVKPGPALDALERYAFAPRNEATRQGIRTDALVVIRNGQLVYERYATPTDAATPHLTWSISKSVLATLLGVAYGEGRFQLDDSVARYYSPFQAHADVRLRDLLHWASGLQWQEDYEYAPLRSSVVAMLYTRGHEDMARFTAERPAAAPPGAQFVYSSGDSTVLAAALKGMVGEGAYADYPWHGLFDPLGITSATWERDETGTFVGSSYAYMTARDLARIGLLMERDGRWQGRQLLPKAWVEFCLTPFSPSPSVAGEAAPGGQWWLNRATGGAPLPWPDAPVDTFAALGHWGQALYVIPSARLVIVRYGDDRDGTYQHDQLLKLALAAFGPGSPP